MIDPTTGEEWIPEFEGQRPPFQPGNTLAVTHGAWSAARVDPIARRLIEEVASDPATSYLASASFHATLWNWAVAQARVELVGEWIATMTIEQAAYSAQGQTSPLELQRKFMAAALNLAKELALTPKARASMGKDITQANEADAATMLTEARRRAEENARKR